MKAVIYTVAVITGIIILISMARTKKFVGALLITALQGITALIAAGIVGSFTGINISVNAYTLVFSSIGGIPGVVFLLIAGVILR